jgi:hypothetical protein
LQVLSGNQNKPFIAKSIELDEKIPFISKLKRYASMSAHPEVYSFRTEEFKQAE